MSLNAKIVEVTPELARKLLNRNTHNRNISGARVEQYVADIKAGAWAFNGEAIKISEDDQILDGQHRLWAVVEAERPIQTLFITGLPAEAQETMDQGRPRGLGDVLKLRGVSNYTNLAAATKIVAFYERDGLPYQDAYKPGVTVHQALKTLDRNPGLAESVTAVLEVKRPWIPASQLAALHYLFTVVDQEEADDFLRKFMLGEGITAADPVWVLRERLIRAHGDRLNPVHPRVKLAFVIRAWNAYRAGEQIVRLVWQGGAHPDRFPRISGLDVPEHLRRDGEGVEPGSDAAA